MLILIPIALGAWGLWHLAHKAPKPTPAIAGEFVSCMHGTDKAAMVRLANQIGTDSGYGKMLMNRAYLHSRTPEQKLAHSRVFQKTLACTDPDMIMGIADVMRQQGMVHSANVLQAHGNAVKKMATIGASRPAPPAPPSGRTSSSRSSGSRGRRRHHHHHDQQQQDGGGGGGGGDGGGGDDGGGDDDNSGGDDQNGFDDGDDSG